MKVKTILIALAYASVALVSPADTIEINGVTWTYSVNDAVKKTITLGGGAKATPAIPRDTQLNAADIPWTMEIDGVTYTVTRVADYAFRNCKNLSGVLTVPEAVTYFGREAIYDTPALTRVASLGGTTELGGYSFQKSTDNTILEGAFPDLTRIEIYQNGAFYGCGLSGAAKLGKRATTINYRLFSGSINLTGFYIPGHDDVPSGSTQTRTSVDVYQLGQDCQKLSVGFLGWNTSATHVNGAMLDGTTTGCKLFVPANGLWDNLILGGTDNEVIYYGPSTNLNLVVNDEAGVITATPTDEAALVSVLEAAPRFKSVFGWNTKVDITNKLEVTSGAITAEMLAAVEFNTLMVTFKVNTQAQLVSVLAAVPDSSRTILAIDPSDATEVLTMPQDRTVYVRLPGEGKNGKYTPKINGLVITFY